VLRCCNLDKYLKGKLNEDGTLKSENPPKSDYNKVG